ncbi:MAG: DUF5658 family protein [Bryobacterales bacterium]|nr:DUF5658 family protein [Bryobacteraceae bacterium]MDW8130162.1 DUF5658 family protein [Bryobacterales bacterium]
MPSLEVFVYLQLLDLMTTVLALQLGGREVNPLIRWLMQIGPVQGLTLAKVAACVLAGYCVWKNKARVIRWTNYWFAALIVWNLTMILRAVALFS